MTHRLGAMNGWILLLGVCVISLVGCDNANQSSADTGSVKSTETPLVYTLNYPLQFMTATIAGEPVHVVLPDIEGDPAFWQPTADAIANMQKSDLIVLNGAGYEPWLSQVTLPGDRLLDTSTGFRDQWIEAGGPTHSHGAEGDHSHAAYAFTTWLDFALAKAQSEAIRDRVSGLLPDHEADIERNWKALTEQLDAWDRRLAELGTQYGDTPILFSHPVYQYLERRYGFNGRSLHWEPDSMPPDAEWAALPALLSEHPATLMIWEDEPLAETVEGLKALGVESVVFSPMGNRPASGDFESGMEANLKSLEGAVPPQRGTEG